MPRTKSKATKHKGTRKTTTRKSAAHKGVAKKTTNKRAAAKHHTAAKMTQPKVASTTAVKEAFNKSQVLSYIAENTEIGKKQVLFVFESLANIMHRHLRKGGPGEFTVPGLIKCTVKRKPPIPARKGISPFTGEEMMFKAKPARNVIKVRPLKKLKEMVE